MQPGIFLRAFGLACSMHLAANAQTSLMAVPQLPDPLLQNLTIPADAPTKGMWSIKHDWPLIAVHAAVMPDGRLVTFGSPIGSDDIKGLVFDLWDPSRGFTSGAHRVLPNDPSVDSFCAASTLLTTGQLLTAGGNKGMWQSPQNPQLNTGSSLLNSGRNSVSPGPSLNSPRYYSTQTALPDGRVLVTGGSWGGGSTIFDYLPPASGYPSATLMKLSGTPEVYTPGVGWDSLMSAASLSATGPDAFGPQDNRWWYPRQWVAPDGKVFGLSAHQTWFLDINGEGSITLGITFKSGVGSAAKPNVGATSTAVMFDVGKILQLGGNGRLNATTSPGPMHDWTDSSPYASVLDINTPGSVGWYDVAPMKYGRQWANATALPNGRVLVTGGTKLGNSPFDAADPNVSHVVREPEIWDPPTNTWVTGSPASAGRIYHSTAVLLPNGTVLTAGGGGPPGWYTYNPPQRNAEVFYPPYLFQSSGAGATLAQRPSILKISGRKFSHGNSIIAEIPAGHTITKAALIGLGSATHGFDMGQRLYPASVSQMGTLVTVTAPPSPNLAPPGYYYLFLTNNNGVPSQGVILAIGSNVTPPPNRLDLTPILWMIIGN